MGIRHQPTAQLKICLWVYSLSSITGSISMDWEPLDESEREEWKSWLKSQHSKNYDHSPSSITSWQMDGEKVEMGKKFYFLGTKITVDSDCSHEIKRRLLLGRKAIKNLDSVLKGRDITLPIKICIVKAMAFPVVMYGYESWTIKKAECWRIDAFELWCWRSWQSLGQQGNQTSQS